MNELLKRIENLEVKMLLQKKRLEQALEQNKYGMEDIIKIKKALEGVENLEEEKRT